MKKLIDDEKLVYARTQAKTIVRCRAIQAKSNIEPVNWHGFTLQRMHIYGHSPELRSLGAAYTGDFVACGKTQRDYTKQVSVYAAKSTGIYFDFGTGRRTAAPEVEYEYEWEAVALPINSKLARTILAAFKKRSAIGGTCVTPYDRVVGEPRMHGTNYRYTPVDHPRIPMGSYKPTPTVSQSTWGGLYK